MPIVFVRARSVLRQLRWRMRRSPPQRSDHKQNRCPFDALATVRAWLMLAATTLPQPVESAADLPRSKIPGRQESPRPSVLQSRVPVDAAAAPPAAVRARLAARSAARASIVPRHRAMRWRDSMAGLLPAPDDR